MGNPMKASEPLSVRRVLVLGDIMLDRYTWGRAERVSPEAPVLVVRADACDIRLGGAGAVAALLRGLNSEVLLAGVVGDDAEGRTVRRVLDEAGIDGRCVLTDPDRPTTHKQRFLATVEQRQPHQILRVDHERTISLTPELAESLFDSVVFCAELQPRPSDDRMLCAGLRPRTGDDRRSQESGRPTVGGFGEVGRPAPNLQPAPNGQADVVLISDYAKGVCTPELLQRVIRAAREQGVPVAVDPARIADYERYRGATLVKPNRREAERVTGRAIHSPPDALEAARELVQRYGFEAVVVTLDGDGMAFVSADGLVEHVPTRPRQVSDSTGAGDMALAVLGLCMANRWKSRSVEKSKSQRIQEAERLDGWNGLRQAVELANIAAGLEIERVGVVPVTREEIAEAVRLAPKAARAAGCGRGTGTRSKRASLDQMAHLAAAYRREGKTVVFTNGCFDLLHVGHVTYPPGERACRSSVRVQVSSSLRN